MRIVARAPALPERTSCRYCLASHAGMRSGAARSSSVAWQAYRSSPGAAGSGGRRVAAVSVASVQPGAGAGPGSPAGTRLSHASFQ